MITVCAWCRKELGRRWTTNGGVSHGICDGCRAKLLKDREGGKADEVSAMSGKNCNVMEGAWPKERHGKRRQKRFQPVGDGWLAVSLRDHDPSLPIEVLLSEYRGLPV